MKTLIFFIALFVATFTIKAQYDTTLSNQFNETLTIPDLPYGSSYTIGKKNGGPFVMKPSDYQIGQVTWNTSNCGIPTSDVLTTCGPGSYGVTYKKNDNVWNYLDIYIRYFVDIINSTSGSATYGQMPDTVWIPQGGTASLSVNSNSGMLFDVVNWKDLNSNLIISYEGSVIVSSGVYRVSGIDNSGYSSKDTIVVAEICTPTTSTQTLTICAGSSVQVGTHIYTETGNYIDTIPAVNTCDSIVTTNLTVTAAQTSTQTLTICAGSSVQVGTHTYTETGNYIDTIPATYNCDSIVTTNLTVDPLPTTYFTVDTITVGSIQNITLAPTSTDVVSYDWSTGETTPTITTNILGWHYVTVTNDCGSAIDSVFIRLVTSIQNDAEMNVKICPNPATDFIKISGYNLEIEKIIIYNQTGQIMTVVTNKTTLESINVSMFSPGIYYLKIDTHTGTAKPIMFVKL